MKLDYLINQTLALADAIRDKAVHTAEQKVAVALLNESIAIQSAADRLKRLLPKSAPKQPTPWEVAQQIAHEPYQL